MIERLVKSNCYVCIIQYNTMKRKVTTTPEEEMYSISNLSEEHPWQLFSYNAVELLTPVSLREREGESESVSERERAVSYTHLTLPTTILV